MQVTARIDYAVRALLELASAPTSRMTRDELAEAQDIPPRYLESILLQLRQGGLLIGQRGSGGGYTLGRGADKITIADVSRAVDGPLALVQGQRPEHIVYEGSSANLGELWIGLRAAIRSVMENVTIADLLSGELPATLRTLIDDPEAWLPH
jgi:Rrf2 family protein